MEIKPAIEVENISYAYDEDGNKALDNLTLSFSKGKTTAVLGHNGSGKSTLLRILCGMLIPTEGIIKVDGEEITDDNVDRLIGKRVGMVFQNPEAQFVSATVKDDIAFGLENDCVPQNEMEERILEVSKLVGVTDLLDKDPSALSGGQKQKVAIAGVLVRRPSILLLDESTSMLDPQSRKSFDSLLEKIKSRKPDLTIIEVTHDLKEAQHADWAVVLRAGKLIYQGKPQDLFSDSDTAGKIGVDPTFEEKLRSELKKHGIEVPRFNTPEELNKWLKR